MRAAMIFYVICSTRVRWSKVDYVESDGIQWVDKPSNCKGRNLLGLGSICYPRDDTQSKGD